MRDGQPEDRRRQEKSLTLAKQKEMQKVITDAALLHFFNTCYEFKITDGCGLIYTSFARI